MKKTRSPFAVLLSTLCRFAVLPLSLLIIILSSSCTRVANDTSVANPHKLTFFAMDTAMSITAYGNEDIFVTGSSPLEEARDLVTSLDNKLSVTNEDSIIYKINNSHGTDVTIDKQTVLLLESALYLCKKTNGNLDISVYPLVRAWGFTTGVYRVPSSQEISELLENVNYRRILLSSGPEQAGQIQSPVFSVTTDDNMMIDLGAVAKGYTAEKIAELLTEKDIKSAVISLGGNIKTIGTKPDGSDWNIAIAAPYPAADNSSGSSSRPEDNTDTSTKPTYPSYAGVLRVSDRSVVTSGGYERYFEENGKHYCHIIDPSTGYPVDNGILSVTIVAKDSFLCDGLSTALFVMGSDAAAEYWRNNPEFDFIIITDQNEILITEGISEAFTPDPDYISYTSAQVRTILR